MMAGRGWRPPGEKTVAVKDWRPICDLDGCTNISMPKGMFCFRHRKGPPKARHIIVPSPGTWPDTRTVPNDVPTTTTADKPAKKTPKTGRRRT